MSNIPKAIEAEIDVIGALLQDCNRQESREVIDTLGENDFYDSNNRLIFKTIKSMIESKQEVSFITVEPVLSRYDQSVNWFAYLATAQKNFISYAALNGSCNLILRSRESRDLISLSQNISNAIYEGMDNNEIIQKISDQVKEISTNVNGRDLKHIYNTTSEWLDELERREQAGGGILGVSTGFDQLDEALGGFDEESLIVVGGAPSMGKTLFTQAISLNVGVHQKQNTMFFSLEMSETQLYNRFVSGLGNIPANKLRAARFTDEDYGRINQAVNELEKSGMYQTDEQGLSVAQIRSKVRKHKAKHGDLKLIVIDYLGLIKLDKADRHDIAVGNVTRSLKELAKEVKTPILLVAQANRTSSRPNMRSLKDSSCIEADADVVMFVHRHEILEPETELKGITELIIAKDRHNDGNGTIYMEKVNGGFKEISKEQAARMVHDEEQRLNPPKKYSKGM